MKATELFDDNYTLEDVYNKLEIDNIIGFKPISILLI
jgi:hypothetical protein